jgi:hypothetical protein
VLPLGSSRFIEQANDAPRSIDTIHWLMVGHSDSMAAYE